MEDKTTYSLSKICSDALKEGKLRISEKKPHEYFIQIAEAAGVDKELLKSDKNGKYQFDICDKEFIVEIINRYAEHDFYLLRCGRYDEMTVETREFLERGFIDVLYRKGMAFSEIMKVKAHMRHVMRTELGKGVISFKAAEDAFSELKKNVLNDALLASEDRSQLLIYFASMIKDLVYELSLLQGYYRDIRQEEISDLAMKEAAEGGPELDRKAIMEMILSEELSKNDEYMLIMDKCMKMMQSTGLISSKKAEIDKLNSRMVAIRNEYAHRIFNEELTEDDIKPLTLKAPIAVLSEAIHYQRECNDIIKKMKEMNRKNYLPDIDFDNLQIEKNEVECS